MATSTRPSFDWQDPFLLRDQLTDEERMVTDSARQFFQKELMPNIIDANRNEHFDRNIMPVSYTHLTLPTICSV